MREIGSRPAAALPDDAPILQYVRAVDAHLGIRSHLDCSSTDANIPLSLGIPAIAIGAGGLGGGAHTTQEWFSPEGRDLGLKRILLTLLLLMRDPRRGARASEPPGGGAGAAFNTVIWGTTFVLVKTALRTDFAGAVPGPAFSLAAVALLSSLSRKWRTADAPRSPRRWLAAGALTGVFLFSGYLFQTMGLQTTTPPKSAFLTGLATVMVPLLARSSIKIKPQISEVAGVLVATLGHGTDDAGRPDRFHQPRRPADVRRRHCVLRHTSCNLGHFAEQIGYRVVERHTGGPRLLCRLCHCLVGGNTTHPVAAGGGLGDTDNRIVMYRAGVHDPGVGAAIHHIDANRFDLRAGAGGGLDYVVIAGGRGPFGAGAAGAVLILGGVLLVEMKPFNPRQHP